MQDRLTYANGNTITTEGFRCSVGEPIDIKVTVGEGGEVDIPGAASKNIPNGDYFITLEVNGEKAAYRDLHHITYGGDTITIGDYTISDDLYLYGVSEDDEVVMRLEPVELTVTDAFRAAVGKVAPKSEGGGGGGGVLEVHDVGGMLDKTWQEIHDAPFATLVMLDETVYVLDSRYELNGTYVVIFYNSTGSETREYHATSASGHPSTPNSEA